MRDAIIQSGTVLTTHTSPTFSQANPGISITPDRVFVDSNGVFNAKKLDNLIQPTTVSIDAHNSDALQSGLVYPYTLQLGTISVLNGLATPSPLTDADKIATFDFGQTDFDVEVTVNATAFAREGIVVRLLNSTSFVGLTVRGGSTNQLQLITVNPSTTVVASYTSTTEVANLATCRIRLVSSGNIFSGFLNGIQRIGPVTVTLNAGQTKHGFVLRGSSLRNIQAR